MRIPIDAPVEVQQAFRELWAAIERTQGKNVDLHGTRLMNAGDSVGPSDYVTQRELTAALADASADTSGSSTDQETFRSTVTFLGIVRFPAFSDGSAHHCILFVDENGDLAVDEDHLSFNQSANIVNVGFATLIEWFHQANISSPAANVVAVNHAADIAGPFLRFVLGPDDATGIALVKNGTQLEIRQAGGGGALTTLLFSGGAGAYTTLVIGTDPGGADILRVGGNITVVDVNASGDVRAGGALRQHDGVLLHSTTALTDGAGASAGTLTNAPAAGNPTKWIEVDDNGTIRKIPAW